MKRAKIGFQHVGYRVDAVVEDRPASTDSGLDVVVYVDPKWKAHELAAILRKLAKRLDPFGEKER